MPHLAGVVDARDDDMDVVLPVASFAIASGNAITAAPNFISGFWNTADD
ncbi:hypothetical protein [Brachybacterium paraconglomeratum]